MKKAENHLTSFNELLDTMEPLGIPLKQALVHVITHVKVKAGQMLANQGTIVDYIWFLEEGIACCSINLLNTDETVTRIILPGNIVLSAISFSGNIPSEENIEAVRDCTLLRIHKNDLTALCENFPAFNHYIRVLSESYTYQLARSELLLRHYDVEERFNYFMRHYGHYLEHIGERYAASFANMDRATFYKLKNGTYRKLGGGGKRL